MTSAGGVLALVHAGDFAVAFRDFGRLRAVCRELTGRVDTELAGKVATLAALVSTDPLTGVEQWAAVASAVRGARGASGREGVVCFAVRQG